jgi:uncharacterized repeat protein (TIGR03803 family)
MLRRLAHGIGSIVLAASGAAHADPFTVLHYFDRGRDGANPTSPLTLGPDGRFFGTTPLGGAHGFGTMFAIASDGTFAVLHASDNQIGYPDGALTNFSDGNLYGITAAGVAAAATVYRLTPAGDFTVIRAFASRGSDSALALAGSLTDGGDGNLYGTTPKGTGAVERVSPAGVVEVVHQFTSTEGSAPKGQMTLGSDGSLYGALSKGAPGGLGAVFKASLDGVVSVLHRGIKAPQSLLVESPAGTFYGLAAAGGRDNQGSVFRLDPDGTLTTLHTFHTSDGSAPSGGLAMGPDGNLYGVTGGSGHSNAGTIFRVTPTGVTTTLWQFHVTDGSLPVGPPVFGSDGLLYGTTKSGGPNYDGTIFRFDALANLPPELSMTKLCAGGAPCQPGVDIRVGDQYSINWDSTNLQQCVASGAWSGPRKPAGARYVTASAAGTYTYQLDCTGSAGPASASVTVTVSA